MMNGMAQTIQSGLIPGNRCVLFAHSQLYTLLTLARLQERRQHLARASQIRVPPLPLEVDPDRRHQGEFDFLCHPESPFANLTPLQAGLLTSFGFGQVGGQALIIHPQYLLASLEPSQFTSYAASNDVRRKNSYVKFNEVSRRQTLLFAEALELTFHSLLPF